MSGSFDGWFTPRLHLGLENPNTAGALVAMLLVSALPLFFGAGWRRGLGLLLTGALGLALAMTASRGALVALAAGLVTLAVAGAGSRADRWFLAAAAAMVGITFWLSPAGSRLAGLGAVAGAGADGSVTARMTVGTHVPAMVAAAPEGWGAGRSAEAYHNWFQPVGDATVFRHVLGTHAVWLVERPWVVGGLYLGAWVLAATWCRVREPRWMAGGLACVVAFAVAGLFNHVGERFWLWVLPAAWILVLTVVRARRREWPSIRTFGRAGLAAGGLLAGVLVLGNLWGGSVRLRDGLVRVSSPESKEGARTLVGVAAGVPMRERIGQLVRERLPSGTEFVVPWAEGGELPGSVLLLAGAMPDVRLAPGEALEKVVWLSPQRVLPEQLPEKIRSAPIIVLSGERASYTVEPWRKYFAEGGTGELQIVRRQGDFISGAWERLMAVADLEER